jgi:hypothetical protein
MLWTAQLVLSMLLYLENVIHQDDVPDMSTLRKTANGVFEKTDVAKAIAALATEERRAKLLEAAADNNVETLGTILDTDPTLMNIRDDSGWTLLHSATGWCAVEVVEELLMRGANPDSPDAKGQSSRELAHQLGFGSLAQKMDSIPRDAKQRAEMRLAKEEQEALKRDIATITAGTTAPCCIHKKPLHIKCKAPKPS